MNKKSSQENFNTYGSSERVSQNVALSGTISGSKTHLTNTPAREKLPEKIISSAQKFMTPIEKNGIVNISFAGEHL